MIVKPKRESEAIEAGTEVRSARRDADGDLLHWAARQRDDDKKRDAIVTRHSIAARKVGNLTQKQVSVWKLLSRLSAWCEHIRLD